MVFKPTHDQLKALFEASGGKEASYTTTVIGYLCYYHSSSASSLRIAYVLTKISFSYCDIANCNICYVTTLTSYIINRTHICIGTHSNYLSNAENISGFSVGL